MERYNRHRLIDWFSQETLSRTTAIVVGAGAVGNEVIKNLALLGVGRIRVYDLDLIEEHNLTRSVLFRESDIGHPKAEVAASRAQQMDPNISVAAFHGDFWETLKLSELAESDVLFCCVDNFEARIRCNTLCYLTGIDFVNIGIDSRFSVVELFPFSTTRQQGCFECNLPHTVYRRISERYSCGHLRKLSFIEKKIPTTIITSTASASLAVSLALRFGREDEVLTPTRLYLDTIGGALTRTDLTKATACPCCGRFSEKPNFFVSKRHIAEWEDAWELDATVITSEPILVGYRLNGSETSIFDRASKYDSTFPSTVSDTPDAVDLEVRDQFLLSELVDRFSGKQIPSKFALIIAQGQTWICEFQEGAST